MGVLPTVLANRIVSTSITNKTVMIIVTPTPKRAGCYNACLGDGRVLVIASRQPFFDAARRLAGLGYDPTSVLVMRHEGSDTDCLTGRIGAAAKLRVKEGKGRPRFVAWDPPRRVEALASVRAERAASVPIDHPNDPSAPPGAAVKAEQCKGRRAGAEHRRPPSTDGTERLSPLTIFAAVSSRSCPAASPQRGRPDE